MTEPLEENPEVSNAPESDLRLLLTRAKYWLDYYVEHDTDLMPVTTAQTFLEKALALMPEAEDALNKGFEVSSLSRLDLMEARFSSETVLSLTDEELRQIAKRMCSLHTDNGYWEDLIDATNKILEEKAN